MLSTIVIAKEAGPSKLAKTLESVKQVTNETPILIARNLPEGMSNNKNFIQSTSASIGADIETALKAAPGDTILFLDATLAPSVADLKDIVSFVQQQTQSAFIYVPLNINGETIELAEPDMDSLIKLISHNHGWPFYCVAVKRSLLERITSYEGSSHFELMAKMLIRAVIDGEVTTRFTRTVEVNTESVPEEVCTMSPLELARCLHVAIDNCNIEDLFPQHPWAQYGEEAAAASYHTLAALFIRFGDTESALQCLALGDKLEDSPRSLALKGLIALEKGETLGAVANMVSSLQQYELRKKDEARHYVSFSPKDFKAIKSKLSAGLQALNRRDNDSAVEHFAEAIFHFDSFYSDCGIGSIKDLEQ